MHKGAQGVGEGGTQTTQPEKQSLCCSPSGGRHCRATSPKLWGVSFGGDTCHSGSLPPCRLPGLRPWGRGTCFWMQRESLSGWCGKVSRGTPAEGRDPGGRGKNCPTGASCSKFSLNSISKYFPGWGTLDSLYASAHGARSVSRIKPLVLFVPRHLLQPAQFPGPPHKCRYTAGCVSVRAAAKQ